MDGKTQKCTLVTVLFILVGVYAAVPSFAAPSSSCSGIIPSDNSCEDPMTLQQASDFVNAEVITKLDTIRVALSQVNNSAILTNVSSSSGPYFLDNRTRCRSSRGTEGIALNADCISSSVYRFKCEVPYVAEIVKIESRRYLVDEQSNFSTEYRRVLGALDVLLHLKTVVSRYRQLNSCQVPENGCAEFTYTERLELAKSVSCDLYKLVDDLTVALRGYFSI